MKKTEETLTNIKDSKGIVRYIVYETRFRFQALQTEAIESSKQNAALEMRWAALKEIDEYEALLNV